MGVGFPSGAGLIDDLVDQGDLPYTVGTNRQLSPSRYLVPLVQHLEFPHQDVIAFWTELRASGAASIDEFLRRRPAFGDIGRAAIAARLLRDENPDAVQSMASHGSFYRRLRHELVSQGAEGLANAKLNIVSFNYDRSLEFYLLEAVRASFGMSLQEARGSMSHIQFVYPHGSLGSLDESNDHWRPFSPKLSRERLEVAARGIILLHEEDRSHEAYERARAALLASEDIYFLGFAYHDEAMRRLNLPSAADGRRVAGTNYGLSSHRTDLVRRQYGVEFVGDGHTRPIEEFLVARGFFSS